MTNYCNPYPLYYFFFSIFLGCTSFPPDLPLNNFYCDILHLYNIVIPIIGSVTSVNLKKSGKASRNNDMKNNTRHGVLISFAVVSGLLVFGSSYFSWLNLFSSDLTFIAGSSSTVFAVNLIPLFWPTNNFFNKSYSTTDNLKKMKITNSVCSTDLQATGEAAKVRSTSDRTYPSLTTTERQEAQRAKFCKYVIQDPMNSDYPITTAECLNPGRRQMTLLESIFPIGPYSRYFQLFHGTWNNFEKQ